ncbi:MAG: hypothetical protein IMF09_01400, partial [Proteobacteria bacterium]|nr:hypothetical protein [Pseudomonadota bacterium]
MRKLLYYLLLISTLILFAGTTIAQVHEVRTPYNGFFELEGDSIIFNWDLAATPPVGFNDFDDVYRDIVNASLPGGTALDAERAGGGFVSPGILAGGFIEVFQWDDFRDLSEGGDPTAFNPDPTTAGPGMKDQNPIANWHCVASNNLGAKFDLRQTYLAFYNRDHGDDIDHLVMVGGGTRDSNNGSAAIGFWLFASEVACDTDPVSATFERFIQPDGSIAEHVPGDILLVSDFTAGGRVSNINAWVWAGDDATGGPIPLVIAGSQTFGDCLDTTTLEEMLMCGIANTSTIDLAWNPRSTLSGSVDYQLQQGQYFEGAVDLTDLTGVGKTSCINSFILETRSSHKLDAKLHDFVGGSLSTCGTIIVRKFTYPTPDDTVFTFNVTGFDPFGLADEEEAVFSSALPGTYTVAENTPPAGWTLDSAECGIDTDADGDADASFLDPITTDVVVGFNETWICTFTNVKRAFLTLEKTVINNNGGTLLKADFGRFIDDIAVRWDQRKAFTPPIGGDNHTAREVEQSGYTASVWGGDCADDGSVSLLPGDDKTCTITNTDDPPSLLLKKVVINNNGGTAVAANWTLSAGANSVTGSATAIEVTDQVGTYSLSESTLANYTNTSITCDDNPAAEVTSVTIALGETKTCTFVNDDDAPSLLLKKLVTNDNGGTAVSANWTLSA